MRIHYMYNALVDQSTVILITYFNVVGCVQNKLNWKVIYAEIRCSAKCKMHKTKLASAQCFRVGVE